MVVEASAGCDRPMLGHKMILTALGRLRMVSNGGCRMPESVRQAGRWFPGRGGVVLALGLPLIWVSIQGAARADRIMLRGGGQIRGKLIANPTDPGHLTFVGEAGKNPIIYKKEQIIQVIPEKSALDDYVIFRGKDRPTAEEEFQLGDWCDEHKLRDLAQNHFEAAIKLDPRYAPAHEKLGHVLSDDRWLNADEQREAQGMVKFRGRWMMSEEKERLDGQAALATENQSWARRVRLLRDAYLSGPESRSKDAEKRLLTIREASAVGPVLRVMGDDENPNVRILAARVLGAIPGPEAASALVNRLLSEPDGTVRERTIAEAARRDLDDVVPRLVRALKSPRSDIINRAAWSLGQLNAKSAVPRLIPVLTTTVYRTEMVPVGNGGGGGNGSYDTLSPVGGAGFANYTGRTYLGLTPPVVGPGVVAFGATGVPIGAGAAIGGNGGVAIGGSVNYGYGGGGGGNGGMIPRVIPIQNPNVEVLGALVKLTGRDYGYDTGTWKRWAAGSFRVDDAPGRRVAEP